jgi:hypothetical protein
MLAPVGRRAHSCGPRLPLISPLFSPCLGQKLRNLRKATYSRKCLCSQGIRRKPAPLLVLGKGVGRGLKSSGRKVVRVQVPAWAFWYRRGSTLSRLSGLPGYVRGTCVLIHAVSSPLVMSPAATEIVTSSSASGAGSSPTSLTSRNTSAARTAVRLLPSWNA